MVDIADLEMDRLVSPIHQPHPSLPSDVDRYVWSRYYARSVPRQRRRTFYAQVPNNKDFISIVQLSAAHASRAHRKEVSDGTPAFAGKHFPHGERGGMGRKWCAMPPRALLDR